MSGRKPGEKGGLRVACQSKIGEARSLWTEPGAGRTCLNPGAIDRSSALSYAHGPRCVRSNSCFRRVIIIKRFIIDQTKEN